MKKITLYAPNINTGGGLSLLVELLRAVPKNVQLICYLDSRIKDLIELSHDNLFFVSPTIYSRIVAEFKLWRSSASDGVIIFFHGLPPIFPNKGKCIVFLQNRLYIEKISVRIYSFRVMLRIIFERLCWRIFQFRVDFFIVQTPSMRHQLKSWLDCVGIRIHQPILMSPFCGFISNSPGVHEEKVWDFIYVSDSSPHKNHMMLFKAWALLAESGYRPSLAVTLKNNDHMLLHEISKLDKDFGVRIHNLGWVDREELMLSYRKSHTLIFPSYCESLGLPLLEAKILGMPIVASELDFVRDVCEPAQTFNPHSSISIKLAVIRHLSLADTKIKFCTGHHFWRQIGDAT